MSQTKKSVTVPLDQPQADSLYGMLRESARAYPKKDLFCYRRGEADCRISYEEFLRLVDALSCALQSAALQSFRVALIGDKSPEWVAVYLATVAAGGVIVPLDRELDRAHVLDFLQKAECDAVFYSPAFATLFEQDCPLPLSLSVCITAQVPAEELLLSQETAAQARGTLSLAALARYGQGLVNAGGVGHVARDQSAMCALLFTSGTTGTAKGVMLSENNVLFVCNNGIRYVKIDEHDVFLSILPLHHTYEMSCGILVAILRGCTVCINERVTSLLSDFARFRPTVMCVVPTVLSVMRKKIFETARRQGKEQTLLAARAVSGALLHLGIDVRRRLFASVLSAFGGRLHTIVTGGAACPARLVTDLEAFGIKISQAYGITECAPGVCMMPYNVTRPASCGLPIPGQQVLIDREDPADETGEIVVKGGNVMLGYYKDEAATREVLTERGWFYTGDCGYLDEDGFLYITGRKKNVIVLENGKNVFPEEIEEYVSPIDGVADCVVLARRREGAVSVLTAVIYPDAARLSELGIEGDAAVSDYFTEQVKRQNARLASFRQIKRVEIRKCPFPKTTTLKIRRHAIAEEPEA